MKNLTLIILTILISAQAFAWGKRGHELTSAVAVGILSESGKATYLKGHEFDLGYYANVPDIIWRNMPPEISKVEAPLHFLDWNKTFEKIFGTPENLPLQFSDYKAKMGSAYNVDLGLSPWRISDLLARCKEMAANLTRETQGPLLVCLGAVAHYVEDIGVPLHVTDNFDGQFTNQKGVHVFFETIMVEALDNKFELKAEVFKGAVKKYNKLAANRQDCDLLVRKFIGESNAKVDLLLKIDRENNRADLAQSKKKFKELVIERLAMASAHTALIWEEILKSVKNWDDNKFYFFDGRPEYIAPRFLGTRGYASSEVKK